MLLLGDRLVSQQSHAVFAELRCVCNGEGLAQACSTASQDSLRLGTSAKGEAQHVWTYCTDMMQSEQMNVAKCELASTH